MRTPSSLLSRRCHKAGKFSVNDRVVLKRDTRHYLPWPFNNYARTERQGTVTMIIDSYSVLVSFDSLWPRVGNQTRVCKIEEIAPAPK